MTPWIRTMVHLITDLMLTLQFDHFHQNNKFAAHDIPLLEHIYLIYLNKQHKALNYHKYHYSLNELLQYQCCSKRPLRRLTNLSNKVLSAWQDAEGRIEL